MSKVSVNGIIRDATAEEQAEIDTRNTEWNNSSVSRKLEKIKQIRLEKLIDTDWWALRGNMTDAQTQYRQKLRDIPADYDSSKYDELLATDSNGNLTNAIWSKP